MSGIKKFSVVDWEFDRVHHGGPFETKAEAIERARERLRTSGGEVVYIMQAVAKIEPASAPITIVDL